MKRFYILTTYVEDIFLGFFDNVEKLKIAMSNCLAEVHIYVYKVTENGIIKVDEIDFLDEDFTERIEKLEKEDKNV